MRMLVLFVQRWEMKADPETGVLYDPPRSGVSIRCVADDYQDENDRKGFSIMKFGGPATMWPRFAAGPGVYDIEISLRSAKNSRGGDNVEARMGGAEYVGPVDLGELLMMDLLPAAAD